MTRLKVIVLDYFLELEDFNDFKLLLNISLRKNYSWFLNNTKNSYILIIVAK